MHDLNHFRHKITIVKFIFISYTNKRVYIHEEDTSMKLLIILGICASFLTAIFTAGYEGKPFAKKD